MRRLFANDTITLFNRIGDGVYQVTLLRGVNFSVSGGITGGDLLPIRSVTLYYFDAISHASSADGTPCLYVPPEDWSSLTDKRGCYTFSTSGGDWLVPGDHTASVEPPYASAFRITGVERFTHGRKHLWHYRIKGV